jgi:hypothetical protein
MPAPKAILEEAGSGQPVDETTERGVTHPGNLRGQLERHPVTAGQGGDRASLGGGGQGGEEGVGANRRGVIGGNPEVAQPDLANLDEQNIGDVGGHLAHARRRYQRVGGE